MNGMYGYELILDLKNCDPSRMSISHLRTLCGEICHEMGATPTEFAKDDYEGVPKEEMPTNPKVLGNSVVQFLVQSSITIHAFWKLKEVYVNVFFVQSLM